MCLNLIKSNLIRPRIVYINPKNHLANTVQSYTLFSVYFDSNTKNQINWDDSRFRNCIWKQIVTAEWNSEDWKTLYISKLIMQCKRSGNNVVWTALNSHTVQTLQCSRSVVRHCSVVVSFISTYSGSHQIVTARTGDLDSSHVMAVMSDAPHICIPSTMMVWVWVCVDRHSPARICSVSALRWQSEADLIITFYTISQKSEAWI